WRDRVQDLVRQLRSVNDDIASLERSRETQLKRAAQAERRGGEGGAALPGLGGGGGGGPAHLEQDEGDTPGGEAEHGAGGKRLVSADETRVDARLKISTLEGGVGLHKRETELALARMDELRERMPAGLAPEEVPGGKAREREMRQLERRLNEIGPVNELAE